MRTALVEGPGALMVSELFSRDVRPGGARVEVALCGVCGSDVGSWRTGVSRGAVFGHEWVGRVSETGADVESVRVGDRVIGAVPPCCGSCAYCTAGTPEECQLVFATATGKDPLAPASGGFSGSISVAAGRLMLVPESMTDEAAALVEPTAVVVHGLLRCDSLVGSRVVVQGAGPIGLLAVQCARAMGAERVAVIEPDPGRRALALKLGADAALDPLAMPGNAILDLTDGLGACLVVECSGVPSLVQAGADLARRGGTLLLLGYPKQESLVDAGSWMRKQLTVRTALAYQRRDFEIAMGLVERGTVDVAPLHTATVGLDDLADVLAAMASGRSPDVKVLIDPTRPPG